MNTKLGTRFARTAEQISLWKGDRNYHTVSMVLDISWETARRWCEGLSAPSLLQAPGIAERTGIPRDSLEAAIREDGFRHGSKSGAEIAR